MAKLQSVNSVAGKETIYVDVDDEITAIIDKVDSAKGKVVALVLPKRCPVLQSVVNMKLLKRTADNNGKNLVLVTSEAGLMPLAGATGLYVASTPTSKPVVPDVPGPIGDDGPEDLDEPLKVVDGNVSDSDDESEDFDPKDASAKSVGELAATTKKSSFVPDETINMDDDEEEEAEEAPVDLAKAKTPKPKKDKKLKVPNFDSFRKLIVLGVLVLALLIVGIIMAATVLPKATVTIATDSNTIPTNSTLTLDTTATSLDTTSNTVPAVSQTQQKTNTATVNATGQQNNGTKASGTMTITNCGPNPLTVQSGTTFSAGGHTFVDVSSSTVVQPSDFKFGGVCKNNNSSTVNVQALNGGAAYNQSAQSYTISNSPQYLSASGSDMAGGTDSIITIVQQSDIDSATSKANSASASSIQQQLEQSIEAQGLQPITATFLTGTPQVSANQQVGAQASSVTVTATTTYSMMGVKKSYLQALVDNNVNGQLDKGKQVILDDGVANAQFAEANPGTTANAVVAMTVSSQVGPQINVSALKVALAGKRSADVQSYVEQTPGVTNVTVKFSPFYVDTVPHKASKVQINIVKAGK